MTHMGTTLTIADYTHILNSIYCAVIILDQNLKILYQNAAADQLARDSGLSHADVVRELGRQVDLAQGRGRFTVEQDSHCIIFNINPWLCGDSRRGSILVAHESGHQVCAVQELDIVLNIVEEIDAILEAAADGIIVADRNGIIIRVNKAIEETFGIDRRSLLGHASAEIVKAGVFREGIVQKVLDSGKRVVIAAEYNMKKLVYTGIPNYDRQGRLQSIIVNIQDVSALNELRRELENQRLKMDGYMRKMIRLSRRGDGKIVAYSPKMMQILDLIHVVADVDSMVLVTGESGTGKEVVVDEIYHNSRRKDKAFIKINCGAIPDTLFESELFGYENGAFTGARRQGKMGFFELAHKGTLLLDEVGELSLAAQVKLLRVIQEQEVQRIGGSRPVHVDVRLIAATNKNLWSMVQAGTFRQDLYYRLNVINIHIPPLRERREDILPLAYHFLDLFNTKYDKQKQLSPELCRLLSSLDWPGNIRELENVMETMIILTPEDMLQPTHLPEKYDTPRQGPAVTVQGIVDWKEAQRELERQLLEHARAEYGTTREMARALGIDQSTVCRKMKQHGVERKM